MIQNSNGRWIKLIERIDRKNAWDLEVKQFGNDVEIRIPEEGTYDMCLTIEEIEALYQFAQMIKLN
jgi:hypothetical protein